MLKKAIFTLVFAGTALVFSVPVRSQSAKLIEAGKKEGKVVVYGSLESDTTDAIKEKFQQKTGIQAEYWRASATKVMDRAFERIPSGETGL